MYAWDPRAQQLFCSLNLLIGDLLVALVVCSIMLLLGMVMNKHSSSCNTTERCSLIFFTFGYIYGINSDRSTPFSYLGFSLLQTAS